MDFGLIRKYRDYLPVAERFVTALGEGGTPLLPCRNLSESLGLKCRLYLKFDGTNPTGSFKDRGMTYAISKAREDGHRTVICASTGNTSAAAAAYAARAGLRCVVLIPKGHIAYGKLSQAVRHGADVVQIEGNFDAALRAVVEIGATRPVAIVNSVNPHRLRGQMTAAFEIVDVLGRAPDWHFLPVGNAGNITAYWMGYKLYREAGKCRALPKMMGTQASGAAPIVRGKPVKNPETVATAIRIGNPASWQGALKARDESGGAIGMASDKEILAAYRLIARTEGYFCEPASAASVAGLVNAAKKIRFKRDDVVVCTLTGHGLKDPNTALKGAVKLLTCAADAKAIMRKLRL